SLIAAARRLRNGGTTDYRPELIELFGEVATDTQLEPAYRALAMTLPGENDVGLEMGSNVDPDAIFAAREALILQLGRAHCGAMETLLHELSDNRGEFSPDAGSAGRRALSSVLVNYLSAA